ncbi:ZN574 protein, partial [Nothocercus julius]|nr:ZN574 protein [Nothocercus julius]
MSEAPAETVLYVEQRYVCSECSHVAVSLEAALLHQQSHAGAAGQHYELLGLPGDLQALAVPESSHYQCLECGQLLLSPGQLLEHQEMHLKLLQPEPQQAAATVVAKAPAGGQIHYECVECKALFGSQDVWLAHRQSHRAPAEPAVPPAPVPVPPGQALVRLEHSYRKPEAAAAPLQLLLYECGDCLQLFEAPADCVQHQATHLAAATGGEAAGGGAAASGATGGGATGSGAAAGGATGG